MVSANGSFIYTRIRSSPAQTASPTWSLTDRPQRNRNRDHHRGLDEPCPRVPTSSPQALPPTSGTYQPPYPLPHHRFPTQHQMGRPGLTIKHADGKETITDGPSTNFGAMSFRARSNSSGPVTLQLWSTVNDFQTGKDAHPYVYLYDCAAGGIPCTKIGETDSIPRTGTGPPPTGSTTKSRSDRQPHDKLRSRTTIRSSSTTTTSGSPSPPPTPAAF